VIVVSAACVADAATPMAAAASAEPVYWRQRIFFIPYQAGAHDSLAQSAEKVQLMVAREGSRNWEILEAAQPNVRGFSYHAPADGEYAFAVALTDRRGNTWPKGDPTPMLRVVVDTQAPLLRLSPTIDATGQIVVQYEATDPHLRPETLRLETQLAGTWQRLPLSPPEAAQRDRLIGRTAFHPPGATDRLTIRATIDDLAGNQATATAEVSPHRPMRPPDSGPQLGPAFDVAAGAAPPLANSYTSASPVTPAFGPAFGPADRTPAHFAADGGAKAPGKTPDSGTDRSIAAPSLLTTPTARRALEVPFGSGSPPTGALEEGWSAAPTHAPHRSESAEIASLGTVSQDAAGVRWVNSLTFEIDYDLQTVGPWGVAKVELWATRDGGQTWNSFGVDADNRSPVRVTASEAGVYGFLIVVDGANSAPTPPPRAGDRPELLLGVDLEQPRAEFTAAEVGSGSLSDRLTIRWTAADERLDARPIGLFYSAKADGPWTTIATNLENTGEYAWRLERQMPERIFLRIEARDVAGNVGAYVSPSSVVLNLPQPVGRLRSVRPVAGDPSRFRTADRQQ